MVWSPFMISLYVGPGGKKASLATICDGHGGQQNRQQSSPTVKPFIIVIVCLLVIKKKKKTIKLYFKIGLV